MQYHNNHKNYNNQDLGSSPIFTGRDSSLNVRGRKWEKNEGGGSSGRNDGQGGRDGGSSSSDDSEGGSGSHSN